jgi:iron complex outermembrane receptor protein
MGVSKFACGTAVAALVLGTECASAQVVLPDIDVTATRLVSTAPASGGGSSTAPTASIGIVGAVTSVITSEQIERSPSQDLPDILSQQTGVQVQHLLSSTDGSREMVDLRGFGAFAQSNVLILVDGRRYQDFDLQGFDFSSIPLNSIERVEITRGNSGAVLYGDGAIGGVINIVTKKGTGQPFAGQVEALAGSFGYYEGRGSASAASGPWSVGVFGNAVDSNGYRINSALRQRNIDATLNYHGAPLGGYLRIAADRQNQGLPGGLGNQFNAFVGPYTLDTPWQSNTPLDWADKQGVNVTGGVTATLAPGVEMIVDGAVRRKFQQAQFYNYITFDPFFNPTFTVAGATPLNYVDTVMTTTSITPRFDVHHNFFGVPGRLLTGIDVYNTQYNSDRPTAPGMVPVHSYDIRQLSTGFYAMNTSAIRPDTDVSFGGRIQRNEVHASDIYSAIDDPNALFYGPNNPEAPPLDTAEWQWAAHLGLEHQLSQNFAVFGRVARAFRLPNADERVGAGSPFVLVPPNFALRTQTSEDVEGGVRVNVGPLNVESSVYLMHLNDEIHFVPALGIDTNLDPTQRFGWETTALYQVNGAVRLKGGLAYTHATFREGPYAGNEIPLVSPWSGNAGVSWDIVEKLLTLDVTGRYFSARRMDNDQMNIQPLIPANATADVKIGGTYQHFFWSAAVLNVFDLHYYDYAIASGGLAAGPGFPATPPTLGAFNAYPLAGRTYMLRAGATF